MDKIKWVAYEGQDKVSATEAYDYLVQAKEFGTIFTSAGYIDVHFQVVATDMICHEGFPKHFMVVGIAKVWQIDEEQ